MRRCIERQSGLSVVCRSRWYSMVLLCCLTVRLSVCLSMYIPCGLSPSVIMSFGLTTSGVYSPLNSCSESPIPPLSSSHVFFFPFPPPFPIFSVLFYPKSSTIGFAVGSVANPWLCWILERPGNAFWSKLQRRCWYNFGPKFYNYLHREMVENLPLNVFQGW